MNQSNAGPPPRPQVIQTGDGIKVGCEVFPVLTPTLPPATHTNSYAIGTRQVVLIEPATPYEDEQRDWLAWASGLRSQGREAVAIVLTHHHPDHVGGAAPFASALGLPIWAHAKTAERLPHLTIDRMLDDGDVLDLDGPQPIRLDVLFTPGHAPGHICLHDGANGVLVVGDMVASVGTILIAPQDGDMAEYLRQLRRLSELNATVALPAHGAPIEGPSKHFVHYIQHRLMREKMVVQALGRMDDGGTLSELVSVAYRGTPKELWPLAEMSLEAHLIKLRDEGIVRHDEPLWWLNPSGGDDPTAKPPSAPA